MSGLRSVSLLVWLSWCSCCVVCGSGGECPAPVHIPPELSLRDLGGLSALVHSAESTRNAVVKGDLPYKFIRTSAREAYNGSHRFSTAQFVKEWTSYTENTIFFGGFVLFMALLLPIAAMALWTFCECCYEEDEEDEEHNRNLTWQAQVVVWSLAVAVVSVLIVLLILVGILLGANSWMTEGVERGSTAARNTIPHLMDMKQSALQTVDEILVERFDRLTQELHTSVLDQISLSVNTTVSNQHYPSVVTLDDDVTTFLGRRQPLLSLTQSVTGTLDTLHSLTASLNHSLTLLLHTCTALIQDKNSSIVTPTPVAMSPLTSSPLTPSPVTSSLFTSSLVTPTPLPPPLLTPGTSSLLSLCENYTLDFPTLVPVAHWNEVGGVTDDGRSQLSKLQSSLADAVFSVDSAPSPRQLFHDYLTDLVLNLSLHINATSESYFGSLGGNLSEFTTEVVTFYNSSLPLSSQPQVELYLGARHLENWQWFRSALTITFSAFIFVGSLCLVVVLGRGLYNVTVTYTSRYSHNTAYDHGAHQAGLSVKKLAFSLSVICIISAAFSGFFLSVAGVMGKVCGSHNNFSELLENVVDNPQTWSDQTDTPTFPLASVLLNMSSFPLTVADTLDACRSNVSLFHSFHLEQQYDLEDRIWLNHLERIMYREEMQKIYLHLDGVILISPVLSEQLRVLEAAAVVPVEWVELTELNSRSLFQDTFVGIAELRTTLENILMSSVSETLNISSAALEALNSLDAQLQSSVSAIAEDAAQLQTSLGQLPGMSPASSISQLAANITLTARTKSNQLVTLASEVVSGRLELYLNSSITKLTCDVGNCRAIANDYDSFAEALCGDVVPGMDLYWTILLVTLAVSVLLLVLMLLVASRFVSLEMQKSNRKKPKFYLDGAVVRQVRGTLWQLISVAVYLWWVVYVNQDEVVGQGFCREGEAGCCKQCVWAFGCVFLVASVAVGGVSRTYQYFTIYMIKKCKAMKYRRFWIDRKKAVNFYGQLGLTFLQDVPFLVLVGVYASKTFLSVPSFYGLTVSLVGIMSYLVYLVQERHNIVHYWTWLRVELGNLGLGKKAYNLNQDALPNANGSVAGHPRRHGANRPNGLTNPMRAQYEGSGSDHSENSSQGTFQDHGFEYHPPRLSDIPEYPEGGLEGVAGGGGMGLGPPRVVVEPRLFHNDDESEMSESNSQFQSRVRLDRDIELDSEAYRQRRRDAIDNFERGGVEVAPAHYYRRDVETSTISDSYYYGSRNSIELQGYVSSSQAPDTNSYYESSDYRDEDGDSVYSQQARYRLPVPSFMGEVTVDV